jgi:hypothetical protein
VSPYLMPLTAALVSKTPSSAPMCALARGLKSRIASLVRALRPSLEVSEYLA